MLNLIQHLEQTLNQVQGDTISDSMLFGSEGAEAGTAGPASGFLPNSVQKEIPPANLADGPFGEQGALAAEINHNT
jgi:hypothetical protein